MQTANLNAQPRTERGKGAARQLRRIGRVPAVLYGHGEEPRELSIDGHELEKLLARISVANTLIDLAIEGAETTQALIREVQSHPFRPEVLHVDLFHVHAGEKIHLKVPVRLTGNPAGVRIGGGVLDQVLYELDVECLPRDIPDAAEVDVSGLDLGESVRVAEVRLSPRVKVLNDAELPIASVVAPTVPAAPETLTGETGPVDSVEPALIRGRATATEDEIPDQA
ncbi:MAG: 50S ribosomal protein L25 [Gemmatimonadota bacterium]|nr:50S ribosomal protein L25 [Gemmatimonadota bacterium]